MSYYYPLQFRLSGTGSTADSISIAFHEDMEILGGYVVANADITANNTNYAYFKVLGNDQSTVIYEWSTQDTAEGTLSEDTPEELVDQKKAELAIFDAGEAVLLELAKGGSIAADAMICLHCRVARKY